jgi:molybdopterin-guanine dinucleotide biosynthesis protein A
MGQPKAWLPFGQETLLARVVRRLGQVVEPVVVVAAPDQVLPELPAGVRVVRDRHRFQGPLAGLAAGLEAMADLVDAAYVSSCDVPFLQPAFVQRMLRELGSACVAIPQAEDRLHPLAAVYRVQCLPFAQRLLAQGRLRPVFLCDLVPTRVVPQAVLAEADPELLSLWNINTPEDYARALQLLAGQP